MYKICRILKVLDTAVLFVGIAGGWGDSKKGTRTKKENWNIQ
jgi:hypothetical protein